MARAKEAHDYKLTDKDIKLYARQLVAGIINECLQSGKFDEDLAPFSGEDRARIVSELRLTAKTFNRAVGG